ncbi:MAG TPA: transporter substrate-binding domain-containing protein [Burkholderiales bacterium]|nr:transporter substrate-binding domain-containing protein [Burkholderiales bacterium]
MSSVSPATVSELAPTGKLRIGLNYANFLLVLKDLPDGTPQGIAPDIGRELAKRLGVRAEFVKFDGAGKLADGVNKGMWDVAFLGNEPARANTIAFTPAYLEIPVTFLVPAGSKLKTFSDLDSPGVRISAADKSAYHLFLTRSLKNAELIAADGIEDSFRMFADLKLEALAGLKPRLIADLARLPGSRILEGQITAVQQSIGTPRSRETGVRYLREFVEDVKKSGFVGQAISRHKVNGVNVAPRA